MSDDDRPTRRTTTKKRNVRDAPSTQDVESRQEAGVSVRALDEFKIEARRRFIQAMVAGVFAGIASGLIGLWAYVKTVPGSVGLVPTGAIMAFWRDELPDQEQACPPGWGFLREAVGRTIVGAGKTDSTWQRYTDGSTQPNGEHMVFSTRTPKEVGGEETHRLSTSELPPLVFNIQDVSSSSKVDRYNAGGSNYWVVTTHPQQFTLGGEGKPASSMSPFLALYYCRKT